MLDAGGYRRGGDGAALADRYSIGIYALDHGQNRAKSAKNPSYLNAVGMEFYDGASGYRMKCMYPDSRSPYAGWIMYQYPDGQWITLRKATADNIAQINRGVTRTHRSPIEP